MAIRNIAAIFCGVFLLVGLTFLVAERNRYNLVSREELFKVRQKLNGLSSKEREELDYFINQLITFDQFPFTLVGEKPMCMSPVIVEDTDDLFPPFREAFKNPNHQKRRQGYLVWKKVQPLFPSEKRILIEYSFLGKGRKEIALICPRLCKAVIQENLSDFQEVLGSHCGTEDIFEILTHPEHQDFHKMIDHNRLFGILLGYGRNNSCLFEKYRGGVSRSDICQSKRCINDSLTLFNNDWPVPGRLLSPNFACDPNSEETRNLREHYKKARKTIRWTYFLRNKLEVTLALLEQN